MPPTIDPAAFAGVDPATPIVALNGETMGTNWRVLYAARADPAAVRAAIVARLDAIVGQMSHWLPTSHLCRFNRAAAGAWIGLPADFASVMDAALRLAATSRGAFDPAMGRLVDLWGFGPPGAIAAPADRDVAAALATSGWDRLRWDAARQRLRQPGGLSLDLSGIAKGYAVDAIADLLSDRGIDHALIEVGGELVGRGIQPSGEPWWVDLETPPGAVLTPIRAALHGCAVATSGSYVRGNHSIDPRTGRPATNGVLSVSVLARTAMLADALATAIAVGYPDTTFDGIEVAARIVLQEGDAITEVLTPPMMRWLDN